MANRDKELMKNSIILGIGQLIPKFMILIVLPILTTYLTASEYGEYDLVLSIGSLLIPILTFQIQQAVFRYLLATMESGERSIYITTSISFVVCSSMILLPIVSCILTIAGLKIEYCLLLSFLFFSEAMYSLMGQIVRGLGNNTKYSIGIALYAVTNMIFVVILIVIFRLGLYGVILAITLGYICANSYLFFSSGVSRYFSINNISKSAIRELLAFSIPIIPSSIALWVVNLSDRLLIIHYLGTGLNGIYAVANKIPMLYNTVYGVFNLAWTETATKVYDDGDPASYYSRLFRGLFNFLVGILLLMITFTPLLFEILIKGEYGDAIKQVPILYFGVFFNSFVNFYSGIYIAFKRTKQVGISSVIGAVINIVINVMLISRLGLFAASISTAFSFCAIVLYRAYDLSKVIKIRYNKREIAIGIILLGCSGFMLYIGTFSCMLVCFVLAMIYNIKMNKYIILQIMKKAKAKLKRFN